MVGLRRILRLVGIHLVLVRYGLDEIVLATQPFRSFRFLLYLLPWNWLPRRGLGSRAVRLRRALEDLGPIFVKFGQILSTRQDLLPPDIAIELSRLQDNVPPFPKEQAMAIVREELGRSLDEVFREFDPEPLASASIAQVHAAQLQDGSEVVVKVLRPGIGRIIERDISLLYLVAELAGRYWRDAVRLRPSEVVAEYEKTILGELDLLREAASASQLRRNFEGSELLHVPRVYWEHTSRRVMVMERISGIPVNDIPALRAAGIDLQSLAERGVEIFFTQVMRNNFFHADMHPGNIFVDPDRPSNPRYIAVDFGIMGSLSERDQRYLAENFLAFFNRDYRRVARLHVESKWVPADIRIEDFEAAIRSVCEPIFERPLKEISFGGLLVRLFDTARSFRMEVQPQLVLLQKTLLNIEGMGRQLYPDLDLWQTAKPFLERWMRERIGVGALLKEIKHQAPTWGETLPALPELAYQALDRIRSGALEDRSGIDAALVQEEIRQANRRTVLAIFAASMVVSASIFALFPREWASWWGVPMASWVLGGIGLAVFFAALSNRARKRPKGVSNGRPSRY
ncbi:ubiquinone biosynthesis regulatory protein kinase UbiB [Thioalkalivibrio sp. HK1]|uniref:ubiquinone biosynthesis regulatory protein kinase UbiB n=1 Tax=Thioalkalivibrio sp. HK1 TaxID=1469245 RepID=UPI000472FBAB|nr:ubiquinone biosynthesis regulatory protein kinase UbiB [Thioalkalivibrio sp. HK1]